MSEQWQGDWMHDRETGQLIDGPALSRYQMFMLIRALREVIRTHAQSIRDNDAVIEAQKARIAVMEAEITRLRAPVTDAESGLRHHIDTLLSRRRAQTEPKP